MRIQPVAYRYAQSLLDLALERGKVNDVHHDMVLLGKGCADSQELRVLLKSPVVRADLKRKVLEQVFGKHIGEVTRTFIDVVVRKGREALLPDVAAAFQELYRAHQGIVVCTVTTAVPLTAEEHGQVARLAASRYPGKTIQVEERVDPEIIGGGIIQIGDLQWDASVKNKLGRIRRTLAENPYMAKI